MPNMKSLSLMVQKLWPRLKYFLATESQTDRQKKKLDAPEFHSRGIIFIIFYSSFANN